MLLTLQILGIPHNVPVAEETAALQVTATDGILRVMTMSKFIEKFDSCFETIVELAFAAVCVIAMYCGGAGFMTLTSLAV